MEVDRTMGIQFHPKRLFRFSIAVLLFAMLCASGFFSGYRIGFDRGRYDRSQLYVVSYPVNDLVVNPVTQTATSADFDSLIDLIVTRISPQDWMENGSGSGEIQPFPSNLSLVVSQSEENHKAIAKLLAQLRQAQRPVAATNPPTPLAESKEHAKP
jgi:hypothetical protein